MGEAVGTFSCWNLRFSRICGCRQGHPQRHLVAPGEVSPPWDGATGLCPGMPLWDLKPTEQRALCPTAALLLLGCSHLLNLPHEEVRFHLDYQNFKVRVKLRQERKIWDVFQ